MCSELFDCYYSFILPLQRKACRGIIIFYKSDADLPGIKDYSVKNRTYRYFNGEVLYPFWLWP